MATLRNMHALDHFKQGDRGAATGHVVRRMRASGAPLGATLVTALQDVEAGANGWFEDAEPSSSEGPTDAE